MWLTRTLVIVVLVKCGGCAGGGEALSKDEYVARLSAACEDFAEKESRIGEPQSVSDLVEFGPQVLDAFEDAILDEVESLEAPDELAEQANRLVELANEQRDVLRELIDAARDGALGAVQALATKNDMLNEESSSLARELGAEACA